MKIDAVNINAQQLISEQSAGTSQADFANWLGHKVEQTNQQLIESDNSLHDLALGKVDNLHRVMIQFEQAKLSLNLLSQLRNRALTAYQDILKQQI